jgi:hypothetical protein
VTKSAHFDKFLKENAAAKTPIEKGKALEEFVVATFTQLRGVTVHDRNVRDDNEVQEIDVLLWNEQEIGRSGLSFLPNTIFVEAKNWMRMVGAAEVAWFKEKVRSGGDYGTGGATGILVAANGVTGDGSDRKFAADIILRARAEQVRLLVVRPEELDLGPADVRELLKRRVSDLAGGRLKFGS